MIEIFGTALNQWDTGRSVQVTEIEADHVHFANKGDSRAVIMGIVDSQAKIPDYLLQTGKQLCVYAVKNGVTVESKIFYVKTRERPEEYVYEEDQRNYIYELITDAQTAIDGANDAAAAATERTNAAVGDVNTAIDNLNNVTNAAVKNANTAASSAITATTKANVAANSADLAAKIANEAADNANNVAKSLMVIGSAKGNSIYLDDAIEQFLVGMRIFGKTTQNGTPTPEAPVDLVSSADGNHLSVHVCGKNLFTGWEVGGIHTNNGLEITGEDKRRTGFLPVFEPGQKICVSGIPNTMNSFAAFYDADKEFISRSGGSAVLPRVFDAPDGAKYFRFTIYESASLSGVISEADAAANTTMIETGASVTEYERGKQVQTAAISSLNGLRGIPVSSGGNYTDANGQQWICDEIDLTRGVYIQRVGAVVLDGSTDEAWIYFSTIGNQFHVPLQNFYHSNTVPCVYSTHFAPDIIGSRETKYDICYSYSAGVAVNTLLATSLTGWRAWLTENPITMLYRLATPIETPLSEAELAAYAALHTYRGNTTISNSGHAYMDLEYVMDAKKYIDSQISAGILAATVE